MHPLTGRDAMQLLGVLDDLVARKRVTANESDGLFVFKYKDNLLDMTMDERCARGLVMRRSPPQIVNLPMVDQFESD